MSRWTSIFGLVLAVSYMLAASVPCPTTAPDRNPARAGHATAQAHDHHSRAAHAPGSADRVARWTAPCPCGCGERGAASTGGGKLGARLVATPADEVPRPTTHPLIATLQSAPRAPFSAIEPIPI